MILDKVIFFENEVDEEIYLLSHGYYKKFPPKSLISLLFFFYFYFRCCFVEKIKFPLRNAFNFSGWKTGTTHVFWAESKKSKIRKEKSFQFFDFFDSAQKRWFIKKQKIDFFVFWWIIFSGRNRKNQKSGRKILSSFLILSILPRKDD